MKLYRHIARGVAVCLVAIAGTVLANSHVDPDAAPYLVVSDGDPNNPTHANAGENLRTGVGSIFIGFDNGGFICTATAISPTHILTAAHCVRNPGGTIQELIFVLNAGLGAPQFIDGIGFSVPPLYDLLSGTFGAFTPNDIAVIELGSALPAGVDYYPLYEDSDEFFETARHYGHGRSGDGKQGATLDADFFIGRTGLNIYETTLGNLFFGGNPFFNNQMLSDFDSGGARHNAMDWWFSPFACHPSHPNNPPQAQDGRCTTQRSNTFPDKGFKKLEVGVAPGDSGGPAFIDGKIAGVHSFGFTNLCEGETNQPDRVCGLQSSHGEMSGDTRVSGFVDWINGVVSEGTDSSIPELQPLAAQPADGALDDFADLIPQGRAALDVVLAATMRRALSTRNKPTAFAKDE